MKNSLTCKYLGYVGIALVVLAHLVLFLYVAYGLAMYDIEESPGTSDERWRVEGGFYSGDCVALIIWGVYLLVTCYHLCNYFAQLLKPEARNRYWTLPTFDIASAKILSLVLSLLFIGCVVWFDYAMLEVFVPRVNRDDMVSAHCPIGLLSWDAMVRSLYWLAFTGLSSIHMLIYIQLSTKK